MLICLYNTHTFLFNVKSSLLYVLCTLTRLSDETPLQPLRLDFPSHPRSILLIVMFYSYDKRTMGKACRAHMSVLHYPTCSPPRHCAPPHLPLIPHQGKLQEHLSISRCCAPLEAFSPCVAQNIFSMQSPCSSLYYC